MADRVRIVELDPVRGSARTILDLQAANLYTLRGTLNLGGVAPNLQVAASSRPREAGRTYGRTDQPRTLTGTWNVVGSSEADCISRLEELISRIAASVDGRYLEWRPAAHGASAYMRLLGPAAWDGSYDAIRFAQTYSLEVALSFPIDVDARGLPWDVLDDWADSAFGEWLKIADPLELTAAVPGELRPTVNGADGDTSRWRHVGRNTPPLVNDEAIVYYEADQLYDVAAVLSDQSADTYVTATYREALGAGSNGELEVRVVVGGLDYIVELDDDGGALAAPANASPYAIVLTRVTPLLFRAAVYTAGRVDPVGSVHHLLISRDVQLPRDVEPELTHRTGGHAGFSVRARAGAVAATSPLVIRRFVRRPYTFRPHPLGNALMPGARTLRLDKLPGKIDGPPADVDVRVQPLDRADAGLVPLPWANLSWAPADELENLIYNPGGDFPGGNGVRVGGVAGNGGGATLGPVQDLEHQAVTTSLAGDGVAWAMDPGSGVGIESRSLRLDAGRPITFSIEVRSLDGADMSLSIGIGDLQSPALGWVGTGAEIQSFDIFLAQPGTWTRHSVTIVPREDESNVNVVIRGNRAGQFAYRRAKLYRGLDVDEPRVPVLGGHRPIGQIRATNRLSGSGPSFATFNADGSYLWAYSNALETFEYMLAPAAGDFPDFGRPLVVEVYAELAIPFANAVAPVMALATRAADVVGAPNVYAQPYGSVGKPLVKPTAGSPRRTYKLGVITLDPRDGRKILRLEFRDPTGGSGSAGVMHGITLAPVHARCTLPTGRAPDAAFPMFIPAQGPGTRDEIGRIIHPDLSSSYESEVSRARSTAPSMSGEPIRLPAGRDALLDVWLVGGVPDDPTASGLSEDLLNLGAEVHVNVTPRYNLAALLNS